MLLPRWLVDTDRLCSTRAVIRSVVLMIVRSPNLAVVFDSSSLVPSPWPRHALPPAPHVHTRPSESRQLRTSDHTPRMLHEAKRRSRQGWHANRARRGPPAHTVHRRTDAKLAVLILTPCAQASGNADREHVRFSDATFYHEGGDRPPRGESATRTPTRASAKRARARTRATRSSPGTTTSLATAGSASAGAGCFGEGASSRSCLECCPNLCGGRVTTPMLAGLQHTRVLPWVNDWRVRAHLISRLPTLPRCTGDGRASERQCSCHRMRSERTDARSTTRCASAITGFSVPCPVAEPSPHVYTSP